MVRPAAGRKFLVDDASVGMRVDRFVARAFGREPGAPSRTEVRSWVEGGFVSLDGRVPKAGDRVRCGSVVVVSDPPRQKHSVASADPSVPFDLVFEDDHVLVVDKPAGVVVHPARGHHSGTLVQGLFARGLFDSGLLDDGGDPRFFRPGVVHRIDKGTSGLLVIARTPLAREHLKAQFQRHSVERLYEALCAGVTPVTSIATLYGRDPRNRLRFSSRVVSGKRAVTHVVSSESVASGRASYVRCTLETGRTHQIRVHLADAGHPLLGDTLYGGAGSSPPEGVSLDRVALHARVIGFEHPFTGEPMRFEREPPQDFAAALKALRSFGGA